jgi:16S rRNA (adenine(1408)-N(1))-methyltransferase
MLVVTGKQVVDVDGGAFASLAARYERVLVDVGTGDGRFALHLARTRPRTLVVGVDALKENLEETARKAARPPKKGGTPNVVYVWATAENPPCELRHRADAVQVILPWGKLMVGLLLARDDILDGLRTLGTPGTTFRAVVNAEVWGDPIPLEARGLPELTPERARDELAPRYSRHGIRIEHAALLDAGQVREVRSTWSKKLSASRALPRFVELTGTYL